MIDMLLYSAACKIHALELSGRCALQIYLLTYLLFQHNQPTNTWQQLRQIQNDFQNSFTAGKPVKFPTKPA